MNTTTETTTAAPISINEIVNSFCKPLTIKEIVTAYHLTMTAQEMSNTYGHSPSSYRYTANVLGVTLTDGRGLAKRPPKPEKAPKAPKPVAVVIAKPVTKPVPTPRKKESNDFNPKKMKIKFVDYSALILVPLGQNNRSFYVPKDSSPEYIQSERERRLQSC